MIYDIHRNSSARPPGWANLATSLSPSLALNRRWGALRSAMLNYGMTFSVYPGRPNRYVSRKRRPFFLRHSPWGNII